MPDPPLDLEEAAREELLPEERRPLARVGDDVVDVLHEDDVAAESRRGSREARRARPGGRGAPPPPSGTARRRGRRRACRSSAPGPRTSPRSGRGDAARSSGRCRSRRASKSPRASSATVKWTGVRPEAARTVRRGLDEVLLERRPRPLLLEVERDEPLRTGREAEPGGRRSAARSSRRRPRGSAKTSSPARPAQLRRERQLLEPLDELDDLGGAAVPLRSAVGPVEPGRLRVVERLLERLEHPARRARGRDELRESPRLLGLLEQAEEVPVALLGDPLDAVPARAGPRETAAAGGFVRSATCRAASAGSIPRHAIAARSAAVKRSATVTPPVRARLGLLVQEPEQVLPVLVVPHRRGDLADVVRRR